MLSEVWSASLNTKELFNTLKRCSVVIAGSVYGRECQDFVEIPILSLVDFFLNLSGLWISHRGKSKAIASASPWPESFTVPWRVTTACLANKWNNNCIYFWFLLLLQCSQLLPSQSTWCWILRISFCSQHYLGSAAGSRVCGKGSLRAAGRCIWRGQPKGSHKHPLPSTAPWEDY